MIGIRTDCDTGESKEITLEWEIRTYKDESGKAFHILNGITGYESFYITERIIKLIRNGWNANIGVKTVGIHFGWDNLFIPPDEMEKAFSTFKNCLTCKDYQICNDSDNYCLKNICNCTSFLIRECKSCPFYSHLLTDTKGIVKSKGENMNIRERFAGNYINSDMVKEKKYLKEPLTIKAVREDEMRDGSIKPVVSFSGDVEEELVLNKTNALEIAEKLGDETSAWIGHQIQLGITKTSFQGKMVPSVYIEKIIRVDDTK